MRIIGMVTTGVLAAVAVFGVVVALSSIPDVKRYLKISRM